MRVPTIRKASPRVNPSCYVIDMRPGERYPPSNPRAAEDDRPGSAVLLIHGSGCSPASFDRLRAHLPASWTVLAPSLPGHAGGPEGPGPWTPGGTASRLAAALRAQGIDEVIAVGHSLGGVIATELALAGAVPVRGLAVLDPAYGADPEEMRRAPHALRDAAVPDLATARERLRGALTVDAEPELRERAARDLRDSSPAVRAGWYRAQYLDPGGWAGHRDALEVLARRRVPVLALYPSAARATTERAAAARARREGRPPVRLHVREGAGHFLHEEQPAWCAARLRRWVAELPGLVPQPDVDPAPACPTSETP